MAWGASPVASMSAALNNGGTSSSIDTSTADTIFVSVTHFATESPVLSDSKSNSWFVVRSQQASGGGTPTINDLYRSATPATVGTGHTFTLSLGQFAAISVTAFTGGATSSIEDQKNSIGSSLVSTIQPGSITPAVDNTLVLSTVSTTDGVDQSSINGGFTIATHLSGGGANFGVGIAYLVQTTAAAANPTWTLSSGASTYISATIADLKTAAGGGGGDLSAFVGEPQTGSSLSALT